jgi:tetratricopeptide (TPR) repeat protein
MAAKMNKKEIEEPDKLQVIFLKLRELGAKNKKVIYTGGIVVFLLIGFIGVWYLYQLDYENSASKIYGRVFETAMKAGGPTGDDASLKGYTDLVAKYPRSRAAITAYVRLGNVYFNRHEIDTAIRYYQDFLNKAPADNDFLSLVYNSLGCCYEIKKDYSKALHFFERALNTNTTASFAAINYTGMARIYEAMNNPVKAFESYGKALEKTTDSLMILYLKKKISDLG